MEKWVKQMGENVPAINQERGESIYNIGWGKLIARNMVAGISRAFGGLIFNLLFLVIFGSLIARYVWPQLRVFLLPIIQAAQTINQMSETENSSGLPIFGESVRFDIHDLNQPGSDPKSVKLDANQLEQLLFPSPAL